MKKNLTKKSRVKNGQIQKTAKAGREIKFETKKEHTKGKWNHGDYRQRFGAEVTKEMNGSGKFECRASSN